MKRKPVMLRKDREIQTRVYARICGAHWYAGHSVMNIMKMAHRNDCFRLGSIMRHAIGSKMGRHLRVWGSMTINEWAEANT